MTTSIKLPNKQLFRVDEVAEILQCSKRTVYYHIEYGRLDGLRIGQRSVRVTRDSILGLLRGALA